jgi:hypothetical protein
MDIIQYQAFRAMTFFKKEISSAVQSKQVLTIALAAFGCLATLYVASRCYFQRQARGVVPLKGINAKRVLPKVPKDFKMSKHMFEVREVVGGKLYYKDHLPIMEIDTQGRTSYEIGKIQAELLAPYIICIFKELIKQKQVPEKFKNNQISHIEKAKSFLTQEQLDELKGLSDGCQEWAKNCPSAPQGLSVNHLIALHLIPEALHYKLPEIDTNGVGCSVIIDENCLTGRNADWNDYGVLGPLTLLQVYKNPDGSAIFNVGIAGLTGFVSAVKLTKEKELLAMFMNVCPGGETTEIKGPMALFHNRTLLETCKNVEEVKQKVMGHRTLGPYSLNFVDSHDACAIHYGQSKNEAPHTIRDKQSHEPLITTNFQYYGHGEANRGERDVMNGAQREKAINKMLKIKKTSEEKIKQALKLPGVNNSLTMQTLFFNPQKGELEIGFNHGYAAATEWQKVNLKELVA